MAKLQVKEKAIENQILSYLKSKGIFCFKVESQGTFDNKIGCYRRKHSIHRMVGVSDIIACLPGGRFLAIEVKSKTGRLSPAQNLFLANVNLHGGLSMIARSYEDVAEALKEIGL